MIGSPCINVCKMDERSGLCQGCLRNLAEIAAWGSAGEVERSGILEAVLQRRAHMNPASGPGRECTDP